MGSAVIKTAFKRFLYVNGAEIKTLHTGDVPVPIEPGDKERTGEFPPVAALTRLSMEPKRKDLKAHVLH